MFLQELNDFIKLCFLRRMTIVKDIALIKYGQSICIDQLGKDIHMLYQSTIHHFIFRKAPF
ncbi:hypothetical protein D3C71_1214470 [compost metagenome]